MKEKLEKLGFRLDFDEPRTLIFWKKYYLFEVEIVCFKFGNKDINISIIQKDNVIFSKHNISIDYIKRFDSLFS
jgi:hypothetical protein